jgi:putative inorganic carbon (hco3(-)) transporter
VAHSVGAEWWRPIVGRTAAPGSATVPIQDSAAPFKALMVFTSILLLSPQTFIPGLARVRFALLVGGFAVAAHCWSRFATRQPLIRSTREIWLSAALLGWAVVTIPISEHPGGSIGVLFDLFLKALIIFWLLSNTVTTLRRLRTVAWSISLMAVPLAVTAVRHFSSHPGASRIVGYEAALTMNPNDLALMLNLILPLTVALFLVTKRPALRGLLACLIALDAVAIVATFSRGGFLTLATILVLYLRPFRKRPASRWAAAALVLALAAVPLLPSGYLGRLGTITDISSDPTGSAQTRSRDVRVALGFALNHPLAGAGLGMNVLALNELRGPTWQPVHNVYLEYAVDLGWPGVGLFLLLLASCIRSAARVRDRSAGVPALRDLFVLAEAIWIALLGFAVAAFFYPVAYHFYFYYFAALAVAAGAVYEAEVQAVTQGLGCHSPRDEPLAPHFLPSMDRRT